MNIYYISGTSRGLGRAIAEELLKDSNNFVIGLGRKSEISHSNYIHKYVDLADLDQVRRFRFGDHLKADTVTLINNAGTLGPIKYAGEINSIELIEAFNVNLISPALLTNDFIRDYKALHKPKTIVNISSGASVNAYDGWSIYCTSKAGINMYTDVIKNEAKIRKDPFLKIVAVAPGIIETDMQSQIRSASKNDFSMIDKFQEIKDSGQLKSAQVSALDILKFVAEINAETASFVDIRDSQ
ncbi:MAG: SDR family NAD(P)-dependent oxidoreductase [Flavobacteriales bacterium]|nr:SDR family NAD(P)-dependent oxidoreductase [Flavobacteriales bacterium]